MLDVAHLARDPVAGGMQMLRPDAQHRSPGAVLRRARIRHRQPDAGKRRRAPAGVLGQLDVEEVHPRHADELGDAA